jgi:arginyl-tRNA synthetase
LDEAYQVAYKGLITRLKENKEGSQTNLQTDEEIKSAAERIGIAAIKYYDLKQSRISDYKFEYEKMLDFKGNTAVYLIYSYVRLCSILNKSGLNEESLKQLVAKGFKITHPHERLLAVLVSKFPETIDQVIDELEIHKLCDFIYNLAVKIAEGYAKYRILDDPNKDTRILLCEVMRRVMKTCFYLVGIEPIERI